MTRLIRSRIGSKFPIEISRFPAESAVDFEAFRMNLSGRNSDKTGYLKNENYRRSESVQDGYARHGRC